jgi:hypothetical protein
VGLRTPRGAVIVCVVGIVSVVASWASDGRAEGRALARKTCVAAAERANALRSQGRYIGARAAYLGCARDVCSKNLSQVCKKGLEALEDLTPTVVFKATDEKGAAVAVVRVLLDGGVLAEQLDGRSFSLDPGEHLFRFEVPGAPAVERRVVVRTAEKDRVVDVVLPSPPPPPSVGSTQLDSANVGEAAEPKSPSLEATREDSPNGAESSATPPVASNRPALAAAASMMTVALGASIAGEYLILKANEEASIAGVLEGNLATNPCAPPSSATCRSLAQANDQHARDLTAGRVLLGAGLGLAIVAATTWLAWPTRRSDGIASIWVAPTHAPGGGGVYVGAAFF